MLLPTKNKFIEQGFKILLEDCAYSQRQIRAKLELLGLKISYSSLSNFKNTSRPISNHLQKKILHHLSLIIERESCHAFDLKREQFIPIQGCTPKPILVKEASTDIPSPPPRSYFIHDGRRDVKDKIGLYQKANYDITEIGIRMNSFNTYFESKRESAFLIPLQETLARGINFKCYLLNPEGNVARRYLEDRSLARASEKKILPSISIIKEELKQRFLELNRMGYPGKMHLYYYDHFPSFHASVIDGDTETGHLFLSNYLYGISRANAPVIELSRRYNKNLFKRYWRSIKAITESPQITPIVI